MCSYFFCREYLLEDVAKQYKEYPIAAAAMWDPEGGAMNCFEFLEETGLHSFTNTDGSPETAVVPQPERSSASDEWAACKAACAHVLQWKGAKKDMVAAVANALHSPPAPIEAGEAGQIGSLGPDADAAFKRFMLLISASSIPVERVLNLLKNRAYSHGTSVQGEARTLLLTLGSSADISLPSEEKFAAARAAKKGKAVVDKAASDKYAEEVLAVAEQNEAKRRAEAEAEKAKEEAAAAAAARKEARQREQEARREEAEAKRRKKAPESGPETAPTPPAEGSSDHQPQQRPPQQARRSRRRGKAGTEGNKDSNFVYD